MIVAATGHRPTAFGGYGDDVLRPLIEFARILLLECRPTKGISGMALGWDTAFAIACHKEGIPFVAALPFRGQEGKWPRHSQDRYRRLLGMAEAVEIVSDGGYSPAKMFARDHWMADHSNEVWAMWDGRGDGGTAATVRYCAKMNYDVRHLWERWTAYRAIGDLL